MAVMKRLFLFLLLFRSLALWASGDPAPGLKFIENKRQWPRQVHFAASVPGGQMVIEAGRFRYRLIDQARVQALHEQSHENWSSQVPEAGGEDLICTHIVDVTFLGANTQALPRPFGQSSEYYNYFLGEDSTRWSAGVYAYDGMIYPDFYPGIDMKVYSQGKHLKYDFIVAPGADASQILSQYAGADRLSLDNGNLMVATSLGDIIERKPYAYQWIGGQKVTVPSAYVLTGDRLSYTFPEGYDACYPLVVDPQLIFSTYSGSVRDNWGNSATPGEHGTLYSAGTTNSDVSGETGNFPTTTGVFQTSFKGRFDITIIKYDSLGTQMLYSTLLGGASGESPHSLLVNKQNELIVLGTTGSKDFPTTAGAVNRSFNQGVNGTHLQIIGINYDFGADIFLSRIRADGKQLMSSTYLGGSDADGLNVTYENFNLPVGTDSELVANYGDQLRGDLAVDADGNIYVSSVTASADFPMTGGFELNYKGGLSDALVVKLNPDLSAVLWSTYLGGTGSDGAYTIKLDHDNNVFVAGGTSSPTFPGTTTGAQAGHAGGVDGWIAKIDKTGATLLGATYTGTSQFDQVYFLDLNKTEEVYVYGQTNGNMSITPGLYGRVNSGQFLRKYANDLSTLVFSTTFGSGRTDPDISPTAFLVSDCNTIYMCGWGGEVNSVDEKGWGTDTRGMETTEDAYQRTTEGSDFYFIVLAEDASRLLYGTYMGGTLSGTHVDGGTSRFNKEGVVYHAVCAGCSATTANFEPASDFPTTPGAWSRLNRSQNCNNAAFKFDLSSLKARVAIKGNATVCLPDGFEFRNLSAGGEQYYWDFGDDVTATLPDTASVKHKYEEPGEYTIRLVAYDPATCITSDTAYVKVKVYKAGASAQDDDRLCGGSPYQLHAQGGTTYHWYTEDRSFTSNIANPVVKPGQTIEYFVDITEATGCMHTDSVTIDVIPEVNPEFEYNRTAGCLVRPYITVHSLTDSLMEGDQIFYDFGDGTTSENVPDIDHFYERDSLFTIRQVVDRDGCRYQDEITIPIFSMTIPNVITPGNKDGDNDYFVVRFGRGDDIKTPEDYGFNTSLVVYDRWGGEVYRNPEYHFDWSAESLAAGVYYFEVEVAEHAKCKSWIHVIK
jgi:hypothetical protein